MTTKITNDNITSVDAAKLTGTLPAISGANLTNMAGGGATALIARNTFTGASTVEITSGFDGSVYDSYRLIIRSTLAAAGNMLAMRTSSNGGSSFDSGGADYKNSYWASNNAGGDGGGVGSGSNRLSLHSGNLDSDLGANLVADVFMPQIHESGKYAVFFVKSFQYLDTGNASVGAVRMNTWSNVRESTSTVNALQLFNFGSTTHTGSYQFIGYKKA